MRTRILRELLAGGRRSAKTEMPQLTVFDALSSSFCQNFLPLFGRCDLLLCSVTRTPHGPGLRFPLSMKRAPLGDGRNDLLLCKSMHPYTTEYKQDLSADPTQGKTGRKFGRKFGAPFLQGYDVSEPRKVNESTLIKPAGSDVLHRMKQGFVKFKEERFLKESGLFSQLAEGQQPKVMVIACADSRVCPTMLMGLDPGEVFTVRNVANLVPPCEKDRGTFHGTSAALEFAVSVLRVEHIIVMGHRDCGGIRALMTRETNKIDSDFIGSWISCALPAKNLTLEQMEGRSFADKCKHCEQEAINGSLANLLTFPWIKDSFLARTLRLHGWYYDFIEGDLVSWEVQPPTIEKPHQATHA